MVRKPRAARIPKRGVCAIVPTRLKNLAQPAQLGFQARQAPTENPCIVTGKIHSFDQPDNCVVGLAGRAAVSFSLFGIVGGACDARESERHFDIGFEKICAGLVVPRDGRENLIYGRLGGGVASPGALVFEIGIG